MTAKHASMPANPDVANTFFRAGMIESWGRGIERMVEACRMAGLAEPAFSPEAGGFWVTFAFAQPQGHEEATATVSVKTSVKTSVKILQAILEDEEITIPDLAKLVEVTTRSVERNIRKLQEEKKLRRIGPDKGGRWEVLK